LSLAAALLAALRPGWHSCSRSSTYFGWPVAYGDSPDRTVRAALALAEVREASATLAELS
jgi:hypothetical protein